MEFLHLILNPPGSWFWPVWIANASMLSSLVSLGVLVFDRWQRRRGK